MNVKSSLEECFCEKGEWLVWLGKDAGLSWQMENLNVCSCWVYGTVFRVVLHGSKFCECRNSIQVWKCLSYVSNRFPLFICCGDLLFSRCNLFIISTTALTSPTFILISIWKSLYFYLYSLTGYNYVRAEVLVALTMQQNTNCLLWRSRQHEPSEYA